MTHPTPDTPAVPPSETEALARLVGGTIAAHRWDPYDCVCSCGVVPPVIDGFHAVDRHADEATAAAILASDWLAKVNADARAEGAREVTERVQAWARRWFGHDVFRIEGEAPRIESLRAALAPTDAPTAEAGR